MIVDLRVFVLKHFIKEEEISSTLSGSSGDLRIKMTWDILAGKNQADV